MKRIGGSRRLARHLFVQIEHANRVALNTGAVPSSSIVSRIRDYPLMLRGQRPYRDADLDYLSRALTGVSDHSQAIDEHIGQCSSRLPNEIGHLEMTVLRLCAWELSHCPELTHRIIIAEALRLATDFCKRESHGFIQGVANSMVSGSRLPTAEKRSK